MHPKILLEEPKLLKKVAQWRKEKRKIAFLNGGFDVLHAGHIKIITEAKKQCDKLILAINDDAYLTRRKGPGRPVNTLENRAIVLAALEAVDAVTVFHEENPLKLIEKIRPDVFVNGSEYGENCLEAPTVKSYGGRVHIVQLVSGLSTTGLLKKAQ